MTSSELEAQLAELESELGSLGFESIASTTDLELV